MIHKIYVILYLWIDNKSLSIVDCGDPPTPSNGKVMTAGVTTYGASATQSCNTGYDLSGTAAISCGADGSWSASPVACTLKGMHKTKCKYHTYKKVCVKLNSKNTYC